MNDPKRGEIWLADLDPVRGSEMAKTRPVLVMNPDEVGLLPLRIAVPVTEWKDRFAAYPWMTRIEPEPGTGLTKPSAADAFQVRSVSVERLTQRLGQVPTETTDSVAAAVALAVGFSDAVPLIAEELPDARREGPSGEDCSTSR